MAFATIGTKGITDATIATADIADNAVTSIKTSGIPARPNAQPLIINGNMAVAQRSTSVTSITSGGFKTVDRFKLNLNSLGTWTQTQNTLSASDTPFTHGFTKSLKMDVTTADSSPSASDDCQIYYLPEGQDLQLLKKGTANAEKITIGFWIKATKTGTNILAIYDRDNNRLNSQSYTVSSSDTWEYKVVNFPADTTGAIDNDNNKSFEIRWVLGVGSTYTSGSLQTTWATYSDANYAVGQVNNADSTSNNWEITGVQLEVGEYTSATLPPFQHESYGDNESRCLRYFEKSYEVGVNPGTATSTGIIRSGGNQGGRTAGRMGGGTTYVVGKRAAPTVVFYDSSGNSGVMSRLDQGSGTGTSQNATLASGSSKSMNVTSTGTYTGDVMNYHFTADAEL